MIQGTLAHSGAAHLLRSRIGPSIAGAGLFLALTAFPLKAHALTGWMNIGGCATSIATTGYFNTEYQIFVTGCTVGSSGGYNIYTNTITIQQNGQPLASGWSQLNGQGVQIAVSPGYLYVVNKLGHMYYSVDGGYTWYDISQGQCFVSAAGGWGSGDSGYTYGLNCSDQVEVYYTNGWRLENGAGVQMVQEPQGAALYLFNSAHHIYQAGTIPPISWTNISAGGPTNPIAISAAYQGYLFVLDNASNFWSWDGLSWLNETNFFAPMPFTPRWVSVSAGSPVIVDTSGSVWVPT